MMILIVTHKDDYTVDYVVDKLNQKNKSYYRLNCEDILEKKNVDILVNNEFKTDIGNYTKFQSVWFRRTKYPDYGINDMRVLEYCNGEFESFLHNLWHSIDSCKWLSLPEHIYRSENKLLQLKIARQIGFKIPNTLVTSSLEKIKDFYFANNQDIIIKPLSNNRLLINNTQQLVFTSKVTEEDLECYSQYLNLPSIFQRNISKALELRVTVVGEKVFAASVNSQDHENTKIDWRREKLKFDAFELPLDLVTQCIQLTKALNISFGAIDLIKDKDGNYIFLEINPNGQWAWIEIDTGLPISNSIIDFLNE